MAAFDRKNVKTGSMVIYTILLLVAVSAMILLRNCDRFSKSVPETKSDELLVAIEYSPLSCYTYEDTLGGFSYDLLRMVARHAGLELKFQPMVKLSESLDKLKQGDYKLVSAEFPVTKENKEEYLFSSPIYLDRQVLVQRKKDDGSVAVGSPLDLANDTVWVVDGSSIQTRLLNLSHEIGDTIYVNRETEYGAEQLFLRVATGEIKFAVMNERVAKKMAAGYPYVDVSTGISFSQFQSWVIRKGDDAFCDSINTWLDAVRLSPEYATLYKRYFQEE